MSEFKNLTPAEVIKRMKNIPAMSIVGASGAGKTTAASNLLNPDIALYTSIGIGEKSQTTIIPSNFILDSRIEKNYEFALFITKKELDKKLIMGKIFEAIADEFIDNDYDIEDASRTIDDCEWAENFLEPKDASYHLNSIKDELDISKLVELSKEVLRNVNIAFFEQSVSERKSALGKKAPKAKDLKRAVFTEYCLDSDLNVNIANWVQGMESVINNKLKKLFGVENPFVHIFSYTTTDEGKNILVELYNPEKPYSLIIETIDIACRPREEAISTMKQKNPRIPFRMKLMDTIGMTQEGLDEYSLSLGIDRALAKSVNGIILLINLEEREDTIQNICEGLNEKINKLKNKSDVYILFSKGDKLTETKIDKRKAGLKTNQEDYNREIEVILKEISDSIEKYSRLLDSNIAGMRWQSLSYKDESIDPRIIAIKGNNEFSDEERSEYIKYFLPEGLFEFIIDALYEQQLRLLPENSEPILVTVNNIEDNPLKVCILQNKLNDILDEISQYLSANRSVVGQYKGILDEAVYFHSTISTYYYKLKNGQGHTSRAKVYDNISINMKMLIWSALSNHNLNINEILNKGSLDILFDNLEDKEIYNILRKINLDSKLVVKSTADEQKETLKKYYLDLIINNIGWIEYQVLNRVSMNLSYDNEYIKAQIDEIYFKPGISYTETFKRMQSKFREIFASEHFKKMLCEEIGTVVSEIINRGFVVI